jgi:hypothetical protein
MLSLVERQASICPSHLITSVSLDVKPSHIKNCTTTSLTFILDACIKVSLIAGPMERSSEAY